MGELPDDPTTPEQWQVAVDAAAWCLTVDSCRQYGLLRGGPKVNVERCQAVVDEGKARGIEPSADYVERYTAAWNEAAQQDPGRKRVRETGKG